MLEIRRLASVQKIHGPFKYYTLCLLNQIFIVDILQRFHRVDYFLIHNVVHGALSRHFFSVTVVKIFRTKLYPIKNSSYLTIPDELEADLTLIEKLWVRAFQRFQNQHKRTHTSRVVRTSNRRPDGCLVGTKLNGLLNAFKILNGNLNFLKPWFRQRIVTSTIKSSGWCDDISGVLRRDIKPYFMRWQL